MLTFILLSLPTLVVMGIGVTIYLFNLMRGARRYY